MKLRKSFFKDYNFTAIFTNCARGMPTSAEDPMPMLKIEYFWPWVGTTAKPPPIL